jgi:hypothetical protein
MIKALFAVWDSLAERRALPEELYVVELGVGNGSQARTWLDAFRELDAEHGHRYYRRLHYLMGDYSPHVLELARAAVADHAQHVSSLVLDAQRPMTALGFLRFKVFLVYISNVYDNLPTDEIATIGQRDHLVQTRAYLDEADALAIAAGVAATPDALGGLIDKLLQLGPTLLAEAAPAHIPDPAAGVAFWRACWSALRLQERYVPLYGLDTYEIAPGISGELLRPMTATGGDLRLHAANGAAASFADHAAAAAPVRAAAVPRHLHHGDRPVPHRLPRAGQVRRVGRQLGQRPPARPHRRPHGLRRGVRPVRAARQQHRHPHRRRPGLTMSRPLTTTVIGSWSVPDWLERAKTAAYHGGVSRTQLSEMHDMAIKAVLKDQEVAGIDVVTDGELRRDNDVDHLLAARPRCRGPRAGEGVLLRLPRPRAAGPHPGRRARAARARRGPGVHPHLHRTPGAVLDDGAVLALPAAAHGRRRGLRRLGRAGPSWCSTSPGCSTPRPPRWRRRAPSCCSSTSRSSRATRSTWSWPSRP